MPYSSQSIPEFWSTTPFFGSPLEELLSRFWYAILLVAAIFFILFGLSVDGYRGFPRPLSEWVNLFDNPFITSLGVALLLSTFAFKSWQNQIRRTFGTAVEKGIIGHTPREIEAFLDASRNHGRRSKSSIRFAFVAVAVCITLVANRDVLRRALELPSYPLMVCVAWFLFFAYAVGAAAWCLISSSLWIARVSRHLLRIQPGHSDECCGLQQVGLCCLQSAIPLLIGMVLCLVWINSRHIPSFRNFYEGWLIIIVPIAYLLMALFFLLACALVFLPVMGLHKRLEHYKSIREYRYTLALEAELRNIEEALASNDVDRSKAASDRIKLVQCLDSRTLKLATWPFDQTSLLKYGVTPLFSLAASFGKEAVKLLAK